jgi:hypothetical protein
MKKPLKLGEPVRERTMCQCGKRYWVIRELHFDPLDGYWLSQSQTVCPACERAALGRIARVPPPPSAAPAAAKA